MEPILAIDIETYSDLSVSDVGSAAYAEHESTGVHCVVAILATEQEQFIYRWTPGRPVPGMVRDHIEWGGLVLAHNWTFESSIMRHVLTDWPRINIEQWADTAQLATLLALPDSLAGLAKTLGVSEQKDMVGKALMKQCMHRAEITDEERDRLLDYCEQDVRATLDCWWKLQKIVSLTPAEQNVLHQDRVINTRGAYIDTELASSLAALANQREMHLHRAAAEASNYDTPGLPTPAYLKRLLAGAGIELPTQRRVRKGPDGAVTIDETVTVGRATLAEVLERTDLHPLVRSLLELRVEGGRVTSLAKLAKLPQMVSADGRLRFLLRYAAAHTGRWASHKFQAHNLPRSKWASPDLQDKVRDCVRRRDYAAAIKLAPNLLEALSWLLRSVIAAPAGRILMGGDYSSIEARVLAWLAGQDDTLALFAAGKDVYTEDARRIGSSDRQLGKVQRLGLGYGMGPVRFITTAAGYGVELTTQRAREVVQLWRRSNPAIVEFWRALEDGCAEALAGGTANVGLLEITAMPKVVLRIRLPSGRYLHYWRPSLREITRKVDVIDDAGRIVKKEMTSTALCYFEAGDDHATMVPTDTYGGKLCENVVQAVSRDLLAEATVRLDTGGYPVVMHVHDSIVSEVSEAASPDRFRELMVRLPPWATGLPVAADVYRGRYFRG